MKTKNLLRYIPIFLVGQLLFMQCTNNGSQNIGQQNQDQELQNTDQSLGNDQINKTLKIQPAFEKVDVPFEKHLVNAGQGKIIHIASGTSIEIPANIFVDAKGNPIKGNVEISYREFHDAADIIASGIPMHDPTSGQYMETAGMFEIQGHFNGEEVFVKEGKEIKVNLASFNPGEDFDFFHLDPKDCRWDKKQENGKPSINLVKQSNLAALEKQTPAKPATPIKMGDNNKFVFDMDINYNRFPELKLFKDIVWQYAGNPNDADNPEKAKWAFEENWSSIKLDRATDESGCFLLTLKNGNKKFESRVLPVLTGDDYNKAMLAFNEQLKNYEKIRYEQQNKQKRYAQEADILRSYNVSNFGIFNWDIWKDPKRIQFQVKLDYSPEFDFAELMSDLTVFLVTENARSVVRYSQVDLNKFSMDPTQDNLLIAVLPDNHVAYFTAKDFKELTNKKEFKEKGLFVLKMHTAKSPVSSTQDLKEIMAMAQ